MGVATCRSVRRYAPALVVFASLIAGGCGPQSPALPTYMQPELLYLKDRPYTRLYVEVDVMEGIEISHEWLDELEVFLARYCSKPGGITIARDEPVPASTTAELPMDFVAILCTDGPPADEADQPAYLHVVFYDSSKWPRQKARYPYVRTACPTAILCDVDYGFRRLKDRVAGAILRHEAGHILGLCKSREHGDGVHCRNHGCLMQRSPDIGSQMGLLVGASLENKLCNDCERDLESPHSQAGPDPIHFLGPLLVRHEDEYDVVRLPGYDMLVIGPTGHAYNWRTILTRAKEAIRKAAQDGSIERLDPRARSKGTLTCYDTMHSTQVEPGTDRFTAILGKAAQDPCPRIRKHARWLLQGATGVDIKDEEEP